MKLIRLIIATVSLAISAQPPAVRGADPQPYIPFDLQDALTELDRILEPAARDQVREKPIGMQVRNRWRLWQADSRLAQYFRVKGVYNGDLIWGIIADAYLARREKRPFEFRTALRQALAYPGNVNIPSDLGQTPPDFKQLRITHCIQRDDLSVIHVFSTLKGDAKWIFIHGVGWREMDDGVRRQLAQPSSVSVPWIE